MGIERGDRIELEYTGRLADGTVIDTSREDVAESSTFAEEHPDRDYGSISVQVGGGDLLPGLEAGLVGMEPGEAATVTVPPEDGFGEHDDEQVVEIGRDELAAGLGQTTPVEGMQIHTEEGAIGHVTDVTGDRVRVDFNHVLAGETVEFDVEVVEIVEVESEG